MALCNEPLVELANSGASGALFYVTNDDEFVVKTVQHKEAEFLQKLLPGYYLVSEGLLCCTYTVHVTNRWQFFMVYIYSYRP